MGCDCVTSIFSLHHNPKSLISLAFSISIFLLISSFPGMRMQDVGSSGNQLFREILRDEAANRLHELGKISDADGYLERTFMSPASVRASNAILSWMQDAGLRTWVDQMGNVHGRTDSMNANAEALLLGSHLDTVIDAGMYDGPLGIICAVSALKALKISGRLEKLKRPVEVIAFSDEEGVRFQTTFLGSGAIAGILPVSALQLSDRRFHPYISQPLSLHDTIYQYI
eukprot:TRINITY_DN3566_c0_g1_i4.p2 TRINITY_DN3566_c0_g1~~TRINITY_DN3566_c0_g1_i4.p2  ORF type:complete len:227 (+),score=45.92 TRINITY_DN3566_c0_g1_i4:230-910(+)